jgi:hypothetical protein
MDDVANSFNDSSAELLSQQTPQHGGVNPYWFLKWLIEHADSLAALSHAYADANETLPPAVAKLMNDMMELSVSLRKRIAQDSLFSELFQRHFNDLFFFAVHLVGDKFRALEITEQVFTAFRKPEHFDYFYKEPPEGSKAYLYLQTRNSCIDFLRTVAHTVPTKAEMAAKKLNERTLARIFNKLKNAVNGK